MPNFISVLLLILGQVRLNNIMVVLTVIISSFITLLITLLNNNALNKRLAVSDRLNREAQREIEILKAEINSSHSNHSELRGISRKVSELLYEEKLKTIIDVWKNIVELYGAYPMILRFVDQFSPSDIKKRNSPFFTRDAAEQFKTNSKLKSDFEEFTLKARSINLLIQSNKPILGPDLYKLMASLGSVVDQIAELQKKYLVDFEFKDYWFDDETIVGINDFAMPKNILNTLGKSRGSYMVFVFSEYSNKIAEVIRNELSVTSVTTDLKGVFNDFKSNTPNYSVNLEKV